MRRLIALVVVLQSIAVVVQGQRVPPVTHVPLPTPSPRPSTGSVIHIDRPGSSVAQKSVTYIIDSVYMWPVVARSGLRLVPLENQPSLGDLSAEDIASIEVYKGQRAVAHGACPETAVVWITTKGGHWRPPSGVEAMKVPACPLIVAERRNRIVRGAWTTLGVTTGLLAVAAVVRAW